MPEDSETNKFTGFEKFRDKNYKFLYWVDKPSKIKEVLETTAGIYGIEIGFGQELTRVTLIESNINWILTEPDKSHFDLAKRCLGIVWKDVPNPKPGKGIFAINTRATFETVGKASIILTRNPDYRGIQMGG